MPISKQGLNHFLLNSQTPNIDGLLDSFVYMNDDVFLGGKWNFEKSLGFDNHLFVSEVYLETTSSLIEGIETLHNTKNIVSRDILLKKFPDYQHTLRELAHGPKIFSRKAFFELEQLFPEIFHQSKEEIFRRKSKISIIDLYARLQIHLQKAKIVEADIRMLETHDEFLSHHFQSLKKDFLAIEAFCLNDTLDDNSTHPNFSLSKSELEKIFPNPSPFEKT